ncbi:ATP-dependent DNA helicase srs2 [Elasticomyces elasticus]|nr:ATP-dependent DNA helicase srs2 [Elasticomyces elasticus]
MARPARPDILKDRTTARGNMPSSGNGAQSMALSKNARAAGQRGSTGSHVLSTPAMKSKKSRQPSVETKKTTGKARERDIARMESIAGKSAKDAVKERRLVTRKRAIEAAVTKHSAPCANLHEALDRLVLDWSVYLQARTVREEFDTLRSKTMPVEYFQDLERELRKSYNKTLDELQAIIAVLGSDMKLRADNLSVPPSGIIVHRIELDEALEKEMREVRRFANRNAVLTTSSKRAAATAGDGLGGIAGSRKRKAEISAGESSSVKRSKLGASAASELGEVEKAVAMPSTGRKRKAEEGADGDSGRVKVSKTEPARTEGAKAKGQTVGKKMKKASSKSPVQPVKRQDGDSLDKDPAVIEEPTNSVREASEVQGDESKPRGIHRHDLECFSISAIQLLAAALAGKDLDGVLGSVNADVALEVGADTADRLNQGARITHNSKIAKTIRKAVEALGGDAKSALKSKVHEILQELRDDTASGNVSLYAFQTLFATGAVDDQERAHLNGKTQQDSFEFFQKLMNVLCGDNDAMASGLRELFEISTTTSRICTQGCAQEATPQPDAMYHTFVVPTAKAAGDQEHNLQSLIDDSMKNETERTCSKCADPLVEETKVTSQSEYVVLHMSRAKFVNNKSFKAKTAVALPLDTGVNFGDAQYDLAAAVMHEGPTSVRGHYTMFRKHAAEWWLLNDDKITKMLPMDSAKSQSTMLLLKKRQS